jgi:hypothetical protein
MYTYIYTHTQTHTHTHKITDLHTHAQTHRLSHTQTQTHTLTPTFAYTHEYTHKHTPKQTRTHTHKLWYRYEQPLPNLEQLQQAQELQSPSFSEGSTLASTTAPPNVANTVAASHQVCLYLTEGYEKGWPDAVFFGLGKYQELSHIRRTHTVLSNPRYK